MERDYDHLSKAERKQAIEIEERLRGPSGRMPLAWELKRRKEHLEKIKPRLEKRFRLLLLVSAPIGVIAFIIWIASRLGWLNFSNDWAMVALLAVVLLPAGLVELWARWPLINMPGSMDELNTELMILDTYIERKEPSQ